MKVKVELRRSDITQGSNNKLSHDKCPWGLAIQRAFPKYSVFLSWNFSFTDVKVYLNKDMVEKIFFLPKRVVRPLKAWSDRNGKLKRAQFTVEI